MIGWVAGSALRALLVMLVFIAPFLSSPVAEPAGSVVYYVLAVCIGAFVGLEYLHKYPSLVEFRYAPPYNRLRFIWFAFVVAISVLLLQNPPELGAITAFIRPVGTILGHLLDFPYSPVDAILSTAPLGTSSQTLDAIRASVGVGLTGALLSSAYFLLMVKVSEWPKNSGQFNVWTNLPLIDPVSGENIVDTIQRKAKVNIMIGILAPYGISVILIVLRSLGIELLAAGTQVIVWMMVAYSFVPLHAVMRGIALWRIAQLIDEKRRSDVLGSALQTI